ncbi:class I SAM-dependent methyltransferase [Candidatus Lucifugimonas marina]|uniref:Methyltransferase domain-containing protein n=1 Tax=Candidatus Lucifugimonas marina TaxID=3038979 RepID=A0AAJ5ZH76_9CHLR|nr:methyltransferase domain-containing protein [SAR202 cluster bacterium JH702]MDG0868257.1 methyltransferase domain-containing protein [SAR202 cluster bacterium JH639]WFG34901.1 methyltransferase domain-containing protein [SAR202 cluster bacterium JH545]WFG38852.1 methyltransferase domain-containing protein [SAR202 cluster bacterium JH1073]
MTKVKSDNQRMRNDWDSRAQVNALHYNSPSHKPGEYDQFFSNGEDFVAQEFELLIKNLKLSEDSQALEIGCGIGRMVRPLLKWFGTVNGIDVSPVMIDEAIKLSSGPEYANLHFQPSDGSSIPLADGSQDFIFSTGVLTHLPSADVLQQYMHEIHRVLTASGVFKIEVPIQEGNWKLFGIVISRKFAPLIPKFIFRLARKMTIKNPMKRNDTYMGVSFSRAKLASMASAADLKTEFIPFPEGSDHTVWLVGSRT